MQYTYKDFYGGRAVLTTYPSGNAGLQMWTEHGEKILDRSYKSFAAARIALGRRSDGTAEIVETKPFLKNRPAKKGAIE